MTLAKSFTISAALSFAVAVVLGQTPPGTSPATSKELGVIYDTTPVSPNVLIPESLLGNEPTVYLNQTVSGPHMVLLVDHSIPQSDITTTGPQAWGQLQYCRTTRLHWFQGNLTQTTHGTLVHSSPAIADYGSPMPGLNDIAHTYTFYLFAQPVDFSLPAWDTDRDYNPISVYARMNFSIQAIADIAGAPLAGNYIRVVNPNSTSYGTFPNGTCPLNSTKSGGAASASTTGIPAARYTGMAQKVKRSANVVMGAVGCAAFACIL